MHSSYNAILTICKRELSSYFKSPVAYVFIIIFLILSGFFTFAAQLGDFFQTNEASLTTFFRWHPWLYLILVPVIGMDMWAKENRSGTIELLLTMPISPWDAIFGKFIAGWIFILTALALTFPIILTVLFLGKPDIGLIISGYIGSALIAGTYLSISSMLSAMTKNQMVAYILTASICILLILAGHPPVLALLVNWAPSWVVDTVASCSVVPHFESLQRGMIHIRDISYYLSIITFALFVTGVIVRGRRAV